jgi:centrosomal protein CEP76
VKDQLEKHQFMDVVKSAIAKHPNLGKMNRTQIIEQLKSQGILDDIIKTMPITQKAQTVQMQAKGFQPDVSASDSFGKGQAVGSRKKQLMKQFDPSNKRYLSCRVVSARAFVDFINPREGETISIAVSFLKNRFHTEQVRAGTDMIFDERTNTFIFEFEGENSGSKFDPSLLLKLKVPLHFTIMRHRKNEKPVVIGTKNLDWRSILHQNSVEINQEVLPVDKTHSGSLGVVQLHLDLIEPLKSTE